MMSGTQSTQYTGTDIACLFYQNVKERGGVGEWREEGRERGKEEGGREGEREEGRNKERWRRDGREEGEREGRGRKDGRKKGEKERRREEGRESEREGKQQHLSPSFRFWDRQPAYGSENLQHLKVGLGRSSRRSG